jgi:hypothetical protein
VASASSGILGRSVAKATNRERVGALVRRDKVEIDRTAWNLTPKALTKSAEMDSWSIVQARADAIGSVQAMWYRKGLNASVKISARTQIAASAASEASRAGLIAVRGWVQRRTTQASRFTPIDRRVRACVSAYRIANVSRTIRPLHLISLRAQQSATASGTCTLPSNRVKAMEPCRSRQPDAIRSFICHS